MKIVLDENSKEATLLKEDGTEVSHYSFKNLLDDEFTFKDFKRDIDKFNVTLSQQEEFDNIKKLADYVNIHNWD